MFTAKQKNLLGEIPNQTSAGTKNAFVEAGLKKGAKTLSGNGAAKYSTTGNAFVDQFAKTGSYKQPRTYTDISSDVSIQWAENPRLTIVFILFLRTITRIVSLFDGTKTTAPQRGTGLKHESIMRMLWLAVNHPDSFYKNVHLFITLGSWKDMIMLLSYDVQYNGWDNRKLNWDKLSTILLAGLENPHTSELIKKYLPQIKSRSKARTIEAQADVVIAKFICSKLFGTKVNPSWTYKQYRLLKSKGTAHSWQQLISRGKLLDINFNTIHGRALAQLVSGKFLANNGLEKKYEEWIASKPIAKFTGYVTELFAKLPQKKYQVDTLNAQFMGLVETAKKGAKTNTSLIVVRDTSSSMGSAAPGTKQSCYDIGKALALFFSYMLPDGLFANSWIEFNSTALMHKWKGTTPFERWTNDHSGFVGNTNFQSVIELFATIKKQRVKEEEFPTGIICISDSEFDPTQLDKTNVEQAKRILFQAGFSADYIKNFKIVLWNLQNRYYGSGSGEKFETYGETENVFYFGGYDGSIIAFLTGVEAQKSTPKTDVELFEVAMNQEVLNMVQV